MYDTEKRIELVKKRMYEYHRRQERRTVCRLSVLCTLLFLSLVGAMGIMQSQPINATGMYGTILLHEGRRRLCVGGCHFLYCGSRDYRIMYQIQKKRTKESGCRRSCIKKGKVESMRKKLLAGILALALCSTNMPPQTIFAEEFTSGNQDVVSEEETPEIFTNEEQEAAGETDEELSVFSSDEVPEFNDAPDEAMAAAENEQAGEIDLADER